MANFNYTGRVRIIWLSDDGDPDINIIVSKKNNDFVIITKFDDLKNKIINNFSSIKEDDAQIFLEAYRGSFRKEIYLGNLNNYKTDKVVDGEVIRDPDISRSLDELDADDVLFRLVITHNNKIVASSSEIRPKIFLNKISIIEEEDKSPKSLIGVKSVNMDELWKVGFDFEEDPENGIPVIYLNKKLEIEKDFQNNPKFALLIFSNALRQLITQSLIEPLSNKFKEKLLDLALSHNEIERDEIMENINDLSDLYENETVKDFVNNAVEGVLKNMDFINKFIKITSEMEIIEENDATS